MMSRLRTWWVPLIGTALIIGGVVTVLVAQHAPTAASFGWYAYQPLADTTFIVPATPRTVPTAIGVLLIVVGVILGAGVVGYRLGARKTSSK